MKKTVFLGVFLIIFVSGCAYWSPASKQARIEAKLNKAEKSVDTNKDKQIEKAAGYISGTKTALSYETNKSPAVRIAADLNEIAGTIIPPSVSQVVEFKQIVEGLLSTNELIRANAEKKLDSKNAEIVGLQSKLIDLEKKLEKTEAKRDEIATENARMANIWFRIKQIGYWIAILCGILLISHVLSLVLPVPYNSIFGILSGLLGGAGKVVFGLAPAAKSFAGVVSEKSFNLLHATANDIVNAVQELKEKDKEAYSKLKPLLEKHTDIDSTQPVIKKILAGEDLTK